MHQRVAETHPLRQRHTLRAAEQERLGRVLDPDPADLARAQLPAEAVGLLDDSDRGASGRGVPDAQRRRQSGDPAADDDNVEMSHVPNPASLRGLACNGDGPVVKPTSHRDRRTRP